MKRKWPIAALGPLLDALEYAANDGGVGAAQCSYNFAAVMSRYAELKRDHPDLAPPTDGGACRDDS